MSCKILKHFLKTSWEELDYPINWAPLLVDGEVIIVSTWLTPEGITKLSDDQGVSATVIKVASGTADQLYTLANRIMTSEGRKFERGITIRICEV